MREIKFRAWCTKHKEMVTQISNINYTSKGIYVDNDTPCIGKEILMQYTGLKDRNGKEIYEGDVIYSTRWGTLHEKRYVGFNNGSFTVTNAPPKYQQYNTFTIYGDSNMDGILEDWEVIGNIYENPELLKEFSGLDLQQVKENLRVAIRCESEESLKKLLQETLELLEGKENV